MQNEFINLVLNKDASKEILEIFLSGSWRTLNIENIRIEVENTLRSFVSSQKPEILNNLILRIDFKAVKEIDSVGFLLIFSSFQKYGLPEEGITFENISTRHQELLDLVLPLVKEVGEISNNQTKENKGSQNNASKNAAEDNLSLSVPTFGVFANFGHANIKALDTTKKQLAFIGETVIESLKHLTSPRLIRIKELFVQLEYACVDAIPIICLVTFLIGIVVAYLFGTQIQKYGANIFIVDGVSITMCRELSPIIVAIIVAGRSGSAFTAQIGTMKINEELDAMRILGLPIMRYLVIPRMLALAIAMPILVFIGDLMGILGGMIIAHTDLGVTYITFIERLQVVLYPKSFFVGIFKAPVFAVIIALIGCRMGLSVKNNAQSLGLSTTSTVVQSIVSVILLNAGFAVLFVELGI